MRKKAELEKRFGVDGEASSGDSDLEDEDKITEQEEAGAPPSTAPCVLTKGFLGGYPSLYGSVGLGSSKLSKKLLLLVLLVSDLARANSATGLWQW